MAKVSKKKPSKDNKRGRNTSQSKPKIPLKPASAKSSAKAAKKTTFKVNGKSSAKSAAASTTKVPVAKSKVKNPGVKPLAKAPKAIKTLAPSAKGSTKNLGVVTALKKLPSKTLGLSPAKALGTSFAKTSNKPGSTGDVQIRSEPDKKLEKSMKKSKDAERKGISVPAPVPTDTKPAKNQIGIRTAELEHFRDMLLAKRRELVGDMSSMESEALQRGGNSNLSNLPMHMADMGTDNYEQEFTLGLMEKDRNLLREINHALSKIQDGTYGLCEGTQQPISRPRLEAQPWARYSIEHARKLEQRMGRRA